MKKIIFLFSLIISLLVIQDAKAKGVIVYHNGPMFKTAKQLPAASEIDGKHVNLGIAYEQFGIFWLPLWNYGETRYVLVSDDEESAWELDSQQLAGLKSEYSLDIPENPSIPFWEKVGLKPVAIILLLVIIWSYLPGKRKKA